MKQGREAMRWNSLATQLFLSFVLYVIVLTALFTIVPYTFVRHMLEEGLAERGEARIKNMHDTISGYLSLGMSNSVQTYLADFAKELPEVSYTAMADDKGIFQGSSDPSMVGKPCGGGKYAAEPGAKGGRRQSATYKGKRILEVSAPVLVGGKPAGTIVIGLNYREMDNILGKLMQRLVLIGILVLAVSLVSTRPITTRMTSGLTRLRGITREISRGELRTKVPEEGYDEIRALARDFNTMAENLRMVLQQIQQTGSTVGEFSSSILSVIQDQAASATQQAASVSEVTATMEELSRTSHQIAGNAEEVKSFAAKSVEMAQQGTVLMRDGVDAMEQVRQRVGDIAKRNLFLGEKSHEIDKVMEIIKEIASEIHLLALNAAIESAAAGEHGRRFSVVASEVRRLAEKTRESTETIRSIISEIQAATGSSIQTTEQGTREVDRSRETIKLSSAAFEEIIQMIEKMLESSTHISLATHQQTSANEQVVQAMRQVADMVRDTATHLRGSASSAGEMKKMVTSLKEKTSVFKV